MLNLRRRLGAFAARHPIYVVVPLVFLALLIAAQLASAFPRPNPIVEPWPPFVMVARETQRGSDGPVVQTFRIEYRNARDFSSTLLSHSHAPDAVGYMNTFRDGVSTTTDPRFGTRTEEYGAHERTVPADWLVPSARPPIADRPGVRISRLAGGLAVARQESLSGERQVVLEITYREADGIPTLLVETVDGVEVRRVEVIALDILSPS